MIEIKTTKSTILIVDLPEEAQSLLDLEIVTNQSVIPYGKQLCFPDGEYKSFPNHSYVDLPPGEWKLLGKTFELSEEQWKEIVETQGFIGFVDYYRPKKLIDISFYDSATESGLSLLASNQVYKDNPYDNDTNPLNMYPEWLEAKSRTMPNSVILIKR